MTRPLLLFFILFLHVLYVAGQSRTELELAQKQLQEKINLTTKLLNTVAAKKNTSLTELSLLDNQIKSRRSLLLSFKKELLAIQSDKADVESSIKSLEKQKSMLTTQYASVIHASYRSSLLKNKWIFLISSASLNQLYLRWRYLKQINTSWSNQLGQIKLTEESLSKELYKLSTLEDKQKEVLNTESSEQEKLVISLNVQKKVVGSLEKEETSLRADLKAHARAREDLRKAIEKVIHASSTDKTNSVVLPLTPAMVRLAASFKSNQGALPWPVSRGIISKSYGKQRHPTLKNVTIVNNGIDINTEKDAPVHALFDGKVVGQQYIPGFDYMVIVSHGSYYTVYSYLAEVYVSKGSEITTSEQIGIARSKDGVGEVHLEVWEGRKLLDPAEWLMKIQ